MGSDPPLLLPVPASVPPPPGSSSCPNREYSANIECMLFPLSWTGGARVGVAVVDLASGTTGGDG